MVEDDPEVAGLAKDRGVVMMALIGPQAPASGAGRMAAIGTADEFAVEQAVMDACAEAGESGARRLYLLVDSPGGSLASSFKIANAIREAFDDITVFVPHAAASGGTLIALAGNRIVMGIMSQLGPLDVQIARPGGGRASINSYLRAKRKMDAYFSGRPAEEAPYTMRRMAESLDPVTIEELYGIRRSGLMYVRNILGNSGYNKGEVDKISYALVFTMPTHQFVVTRSLAMDIGLHVEGHGERQEEWAVMRRWLYKYMSMESDAHFARYCLPLRGVPTGAP